MKRLFQTMSSPMLALSLAVAGLSPLAASPARAAAQTHHVSILSNLYSERVTYVSPGDTVVWTAIDQLHTVIADDGRFQYFPLRELDRGQQVQFTFLNEETVRYFCRVHGNRGGTGMSGVIVVGRGSPVPPPPGDPEVRSVPSATYPTISAALQDIPPDSTVAVQPGVYRERVVVHTPGVTVTGTGSSPGDVAIQGVGVHASGVILAAPRTRLQNVTVSGQTTEGVALRGADGAIVRDVVVRQPGEYGIIVAGSTGVTVERIAATRARIAAVMVKGCTECAVVVQDSVMEESRFGVLIDNAGDVTVVRNLVRSNSTGVAVRSLATSPGALRGGVVVTLNQITGNRRPDIGLSGTEFAVRSGVWLAAAATDTVTGNSIDDHDYGILVSSFGVPSLGGMITGNIVSGSEKADIAWDGIGAAVCFAGNRHPDGSDPSSRPQLAQSLYACSAPATIGVPEPTVIADLALYAVSGNGL